ncbi:PQQ-dependent sugar dehydrogenase [Streptomyces sp. B6B3]|uniref:PQQ-dependent sugar dehydrogenase n=1 Tax=Streptomyces sp. B6B3 TaxID=3153570 RepID=UPI00325E4631
MRSPGPRSPLVALLAAAVLTLLPACSSGSGSSDDPDEPGGDGGTAAESPDATEPTEEPEPTGSGEPSGSPAPAEGDAEVVDTVAENLRAPWGVVRLPDGDLLVGLRDAGTVQRVPLDGGAVTEAGAVPGVVANGEGGLLGLALSPDATGSGVQELYAYLTAASDNRIVRLEYDPSRPAGEQLRVTDTVLDGIPKGEVIHNGGGLGFGPDGMLYAATGDTGDGSLAQREDSLAGKILRMDPRTGEPPSDNPDPSSLVYTSGHRNVQGLAWDADGRLWATEFGDDTWDELNLVIRGGNHGWPEHEGRGGADEGYVDPVEQWSPAEASPSGLAYVRGSLWLAGLRGERLWRVPLDGAEPVAEPQAFLEGEYGRLRSVLALDDDELLVVTNETDTRGTPEGGDDRILRVRVR